jgi:hypothetical protein
MYSVRCSGASVLNTGRVSPSGRAHQVAHRPPAAQATPVGPNRQRPLPGSRQQSRLHRGQDSDSGMLWLRGRDPGSRVHHRAIGLSAAVDLGAGAAHINPSGLSREGPSTSAQPSITAARRAFSLTFSITQRDAAYRRGPVPAVGSGRRDWSGAPSERGARRCCGRTTGLWLARSRLTGARAMRL